MATTSVPEPRVSVSDYQKGFLILRIYLKAMAFAFTGGMAATPQLMYDITQKHKLLTEDEYTEMAASRARYALRSRSAFMSGDSPGHPGKSCRDS